ncbi:MAG: hypothetical protein Kow0070_06280 [Anaerolineales bacterium]
MPIFDRFLRYDWAEHALELAVQEHPPDSLRDWLLAEGLKGESARRTANVLTWLWFPKDEHALRLRDEAVRLFPQLTLEERRALHWGMAIFVFPTFRQTVQICGRLLRLQGECSKQDVTTRVLERYSNQTTIKRSVERILQTLTDWGILNPSAGTHLSCPPLTLAQPEICRWLLWSVLGSAPDHYRLVADLVNATEIFPFRLIGAEQALHETALFSLHRNAHGEEIVGINDL